MSVQDRSWNVVGEPVGERGKPGLLELTLGAGRAALRGMEVGGDIVCQAGLEEAHGEPSNRVPEPTHKRPGGDRGQGSFTHQRLQQGGVAVKHLAALWMGDHDAVPPTMEVGHRLGEARGDRGGGRLQQQPAATAEAQAAELFRDQLPEQGERDLGARLDPYAGVGTKPPGQLCECRGDRGAVVVVAPTDVRRGHQALGARCTGRYDQGDRLLVAGGTIVDSGQDVTVEVDHGSYVTR